MKKYLILAQLLFISSALYAQTEKKIAAFGSSVCNGTGDNLNKGGYIGRFKELIEKRGWTLVNVSRGGDNTIKIQDRWERTDKPKLRPVAENQYLLPQKPNYVILGLSLGNEGIRKDAVVSQDSIFVQFEKGMLGIIDRCRKEGFQVAVANCYANTHFTPEQYDATKRMNLVINSWNLPSINLMGTIDDGSGKWVDGFWRDELHPSAGGHREMFFSIVPTLFDALKNSVPIPKFVKVSNPTNFNAKEKPVFTFQPEDTIHSFSVSMSAGKLKNVKLLDISGMKAKIVQTPFTYKDIQRIDNSIYPSKEFVSVSIYSQNDSLFYSSVELKRIYIGKKISKGLIRITLAHKLAKGETVIFVDGKVAARIKETIIPNQFNIISKGSADLADLFVYRSAVNELEVKSLVEGKMIQSSLEIYSRFQKKSTGGTITKNYAQSLSELIKN